MKGNEIYVKEPWNSMDEYFELGIKYGAWGADLKEIIKKENRKVKIPIPRVSKTHNGVNNDFGRTKVTKRED